MLSLLPIIVLTPTRPAPSKLALIQGVSVRGTISPSMPSTPRIRPVLTPKFKAEGEVRLNNLVECLAKLESNDNPNAFNKRDIDNRPKFGLVQFDLETFNEWCVGYYGMKNDIWNGQIQRQCAKRMILNGQSWRWPPIVNCL
jgi:hypothetical protein